MLKKKAPNSKRNPLQLEQDLNLTMQLYLKGVPSRQIAVEVCKGRKYTLHYSTILDDIARCLKEWEDERTAMIDKQKTVEIAKLNQLEATYWQAWERSLGPKTKEIQRNSGPANAKAPTHMQTESHTIESIGDDRWLQGIERCIAQRCKIMGIGLEPAGGGGVGAVDVHREIIFLTRKRQPEFAEAVELVEEKPKQRAIAQKIKR